ncbi:enoyl-CoA hydratase-related protein [Paenarthrobacter ureafaciens]|uniref:enoyl-CoA hydratase-related protein n=1 Tax=Paenarthrobacter ureafaciens TaxID=37931 RepID=UPI002DB8D66F|nr:enoyl-CoA hydratase-related protein [Paenarthrobacter ureafaciens]MEC3853115.1 enoyl-CoA hydratase-related protein [Paenarthrobacter ureafaciens]
MTIDNASAEEVTAATQGEKVAVSYPAAGVAQLTISRPERRNALNIEVKELVARAVEQLSADPSIRVIVITGAGGAFVAGTDVAEMQSLTPVEHTLKVTDRMFTVLRNCPKPLIAAVEGYALGGGCELALSCDVVIASEKARFGQPEILLGVIPGAGGTQRLLRAVGRYQAMRLLLTGKHVYAAEALAMGLISEIAPEGKALEQAIEMAQHVASMPQLAVSAIKEVIRAGADVPLDTALLLERKAFQILFDSHDQKEGMKAFLEKRPPEYLGR